MKVLEIKAKCNEHNKEQVICTIASLRDLITDFSKQKTEEEIGAHIARINGYTYALVNMDVITEETANGEIAFSVMMMAAARAMALASDNCAAGKQE